MDLCQPIKRGRCVWCQEQVAGPEVEAGQKHWIVIKEGRAHCLLRSDDGPLEKEQYESVR